MSIRTLRDPSDRAVSPVVAVVLLVGLTLVLAGTLSAAALGLADDLSDPAPTVSQSSGVYERYAADGGRYSEQVVRITHEGGDTLTVSALEIVVDAGEACDRTGRLVNLPAPGGDPRPTDNYVRGDDIFDNSANSVTGPIGAGDGEWSAGETVEFRLATSECRLRDGDVITVRVVHTPTEAVVIEQLIRGS